MSVFCQLKENVPVILNNFRVYFNKSLKDIIIDVMLFMKDGKTNYKDL